MIQIKVSGFSRESQEFTLDLCETKEQLRLLTVRDLKEKISSKTGIDKDRLWLYGDKILRSQFTFGMLRDDNRSLSEYGFTHETTIEYLECLYPGKIQLNVKFLHGTKLCICLDDLNQTVWDLKYRIENSEGIPIDQQRLIFDGKEFHNDPSLSAYGLQHMDLVCCVLRLKGGGIPPENSGNMGDRDGKNASMHNLADFDKPSGCIIN